MAYVKIKDGKVIQKQPYEQEGFIEAPDSVVCGFLYDGENFTAPSPQITWDRIRRKRKHLLSETDWTQIPDSPFYQDQAWLDYRQALRDITDVYAFPDDVVWPEKPA